MSTKFVLFTNAATKEPILVNADHVRAAHQVTGHRRVKLLVDGENAVDVEGDFQTVGAKLMRNPESKSPTPPPPKRPPSRPPSAHLDAPLTLRRTPFASPARQMRTQALSVAPENVQTAVGEESVEMSSRQKGVIDRPIRFLICLRRQPNGGRIIARHS